MAQAIVQHNAELQSPVSPLQTQFSSQPERSSKRNDEENVNSTPVSPIMSRRTSNDSDRHSTVSGLTSQFPNTPTNVRPAPAYVAPSGASQIVSEHQASKTQPASDTEEEGDAKDKDDVQFSEPALALVNAFLDQLLYSFLSNARSTSLAALRPAVTEVLKHRLAKDAINSADVELADLLAGGDEGEDIDTKHRAQEKSREWDLELIWKRTRLRVMVYTSLGEMEDDDEQRYVQDEDLFQGNERRFSSTGGLVSWSAAIFLTSVLEYVAEQTLQVAGQAAYTRTRRQSRNHRRSMSSDPPTRAGVVVEEHDVEKVALNSTLGRLWRTWRKVLRNNGVSTIPHKSSSSSMSRTSRENMVSAMSNHRSSFGTNQDGSVANGSRPISRDQQDDIPETEHPEHVLAANIPLPMSEQTRDVDEIMIPGLARDPDDENDHDEFAEGPYSEHVLASLVGLPANDQQRDVDEIEVPGLARDPDNDDEGPPKTLAGKDLVRRHSIAEHTPSRVVLPMTEDAATEPSSQTETPITSRQRSMSLSTPAKPLSSAEAQSQKVDIPPTDVEGEERANRKQLDTDTLDGTHADQEHPDQDAVDEDHVDEEQLGKEHLNEEHPDEEQPNQEQPGIENMDEQHDAKEREIAEKVQEAQKAQEAEPRAGTSKTAYPWMAAGAATVGGASAAAAVWASNSNKDNPNQTPQSVEQTTVSGIDRSSEQKPVNLQDLVDADRGSSHYSISDREIEELDKRKSLLDVKSLMIVNGASSEDESAAVSESETPPVARSGSVDAYLADNSQPPEASAQEAGSGDGIGVARTLPASGLASVLNSNAEAQQAREPKKRPAKLVIGEPAANLQHSPMKQEQTPRTPRKFLDLTADEHAAQTAEASNVQPALPKTPILPNGAERSISNKSPVERKSPSSHKKQGSDATQVQEHPMVQKMAGLKGSEPSSASGSDKALPLTSASIRGPEDFDSFVQGGETLKYTLTPEHVRDEPADTTARSPKPRQSPVETDAASQASRQALASLEGRSGRSVTRETTSAATNGGTSLADKRRSLSRPGLLNTSTKSGLTAREPQVMTESTRDFADFIRSTGPNNENATRPIMPNASSTSLHSLRSAHIYGASASRSASAGAGLEDSRNFVDDDENVPPVPPIPSQSKSNLQARGATSVSNGSTELIDFIRSGPNEDGKRRISRTVAPFRDTMDSDQFNDLGAKRSIDGLGDPSVRTGSSVKSSSFGTSANSRSALLNGMNGSRLTALPVQDGTSRGAAGSKLVSSEESELTRKRYRNKDPYAIDFGDDDDDDLLLSVPKSSRKDESLLEFLRNHEPTSDIPPRPLIDPNSAQARRLIQEARARGMKSTGDGRSRSVPYNAGPTPSASSVTQFAPSDRQAQIKSSVSSSTTKMVARSPGSKSRNNTSSSNTKDLAEFFRTAAPPVDSNTAPAPSVEREARSTQEKRKRGSIFGRSKKQTYLDMP